MPNSGSIRRYGNPVAAREIAGRYRLEERLGTGAMSEVWAAQDNELERRVAIKLLGRDADPARFAREARAAAALSHPNICALYDYGTADDGRPFMVLECLEGGTLEERLAGRTRLPDGETERISRDVAAGLAHAHARGVLHRDMKPGNILFDGEGRAKIADLGIARMSGAGTLTEAGTVLGTAAYISPEQARGESASPASDVYSFGVILYRMLTGRLPFEAQDPLSLVALHANSEPAPIYELRRDTPPLLESVATSALAKDPSERPADGAALYARLEPSATSATVVAASPAPPPTEATIVAPAAARFTSPAPPRRGPGRAAVIVVAALLLAGGGLAAAYIATGDDGDPGGGTTSTLPPLSVSLPKTDANENEAEAVVEEEPAPTTAPTVTGKKTPTTRTRPTTTNAVVPPPPSPPPPAPPPPVDTETETLPTESIPTEPPAPPPPTTAAEPIPPPAPPPPAATQ